MKKIILRGMATLACVLGISMLSAAQMPGQVPPLPQDPALITGQLDNGLTYYIRHNDKPKGQADFYIAQKVGSILENEDQRGLAHFLEHMCFNGTTNFPDKNLINWLESVGVKFGQNLNARTGVDETIYNISSVPVARQSVQDSCLLILHDWACDLTLAPEEIEAERGVIHEEWRRSNSGAMRVLEEILPKMYPGTKYGHRLPIGTMEVVDNFPRQALVDYYHKWYRPDQQAIIVVGDIDPTYIEGKIKEMFSKIPMPENAAERVYEAVPDTPGTIVAMGADKEVPGGEIDLMFKFDLPIPREMRNSAFFYPYDFMTKMVTSMMNSRLAEFAKQPGCLYGGASITIGDFFIAKTKGVLSLDVTTKDNETILNALQQAYTELLRAARGGFTDSEYERAKASFLSYIERKYESRSDRENTSYAEEYVDFFTDNTPAPGIEFQKEVYEQMAATFTVDQINQLLPSLITPDNRVVMGIFPQTEGFSLPTEEDVLNAIAATEGLEIEAYKDEMRTDPLIPALAQAGSVASVLINDDPKYYGMTEYTLSNGIKVNVKPTQFKANEILFNALALGKGIATIPESETANIKFMDYALSRHGLGEYNTTDLRKYLQGKQVSLDFEMGTYTRELSGSTTPKDLETLMELIYATFTEYSLFENDFASIQSSLAGQLANQEKTPDYNFMRLLYQTLFKTPMRGALSTADINAATAQGILALVKAALANPAEYTFFFVGNIDTEKFIPLMEKYIGSLPVPSAAVSKDVVANPDFELPKGDVTDSFDMAMETPQTWAFIGVTGNMPYTPKNQLMASMAGQIISKRLLNKVREEMGATYSIHASGSLSREPGDNNTVIQTAFPMKPEMKDEVLASIRDIFNNSANDIADDELAPVKEFMAKEAADQLEKNSAWLGAATASAINGVDTFNNRIDNINSITVEDLRAFLRQLLDQNNYRTILLNPQN